MSHPHSAPVRLSILFCGVIVLAACGSVTNGPEPAEALAAPLQNGLGASTAPAGACDAVATAGAGWLDTFIPASTGVFTSNFKVYPAMRRSIIWGNTSMARQAS